MRLADNPEKAYVIAEVAQAHDGSLGAAHAYVELAKKVGADAVKFQMHIADIESGPEETWRVNFSYQDETRFDYWKRMEFTTSQWRELANHCNQIGIAFICSPFTQTAALRLKEQGMGVFKVASGETNNAIFLDLLNEIADHIILSSGMSHYDEIHNAISHFDNAGDRVSLLQCTTEYPVALEKVGLENLGAFAQNFNVAHLGLSDHSGSMAPALLAYGKGARVFENHICLHKSQFGPDTSASLDPAAFEEMIRVLRAFEVMSCSTYDKNELDHTENKVRFGKSLSLKKALKQGHEITFDDLETRKPAGFGIDPKSYQSVIGKRLKVDKKQHDFLNVDDLD